MDKFGLPSGPGLLENMGEMRFGCTVGYAASLRGGSATIAFRDLCSKCCLCTGQAKPVAKIFFPLLPVEIGVAHRYNGNRRANADPWSIRKPRMRPKRRDPYIDGRKRKIARHDDFPSGTVKLRRDSHA